MPGASMFPPSSPRHRRLFLLVLLGLADMVLLPAYWPSLADSLESLLFVQAAASATSSPLMPDPRIKLQGDMPSIDRPDVLPADKAALDEDTPVIGVFVAGKARAYLLEAFEHGPASHLVNDVLGGVPISVTHCDVSGCSRVFTGSVVGRPLDLSVGGQKNSRMVLKFGGQLYRQETSEPVDKSGSTFPYREYPAHLTVWGDWRRAHPETDVYMGSIEEATPVEAGGPRHYSSRSASYLTNHPS